MISKDVDIEAVAKVGADRVALRKAIPEVEDAFKLLCEGRIDINEFSALIKERKKKAIDAGYSVEYQEDWIDYEELDTYGM